MIAHQPSILQTALPAVADRALLRLMKVGAPGAGGRGGRPGRPGLDSPGPAPFPLQDVTLRYSSLCTVGGQAPPVLMHVMRCGAAGGAGQGQRPAAAPPRPPARPPWPRSNAGFIAAGTMLHLVSLLQSPVAGYGGTARGADADRPRLEFDPAAWAAGRGGGGMTAARSYRLWGGPEGRRWQR